ncbi:MAG: hypothetical protein ABI383_07930 [Acidobacteriaceae bacterium]
MTITKRSLTITLALLAATAALWAQVPQTESGGTYQPLSGIQRSEPAGGGADGVLHSDFRVSQVFDFYSNSKLSSANNFVSTQAISGDFHYAAVTPRNDIQFGYNGGAIFYNNNYQGTRLNRPTPTFHNFDVSDSFQFNKLGFMVGDTFTYTPDTFGFGGGIPGIGNIGGINLGGLNPGLLPQSGVLLQDQPRLSNATFVQANYSLTPRTTLTSSVSYGLSRFPDTGIYNSRQLVFSEGGDYRLTARTSISLSYDHSNYSYDHIPENIKVDYGSVALSHQFNASLSVQGSLGPQWISSPGTPPRHTLGGGASAIYVKNRTTWQLRYSRSANSGSFAIFGALQDLVGLTASRQLGHTWSTSASAAYSHLSSLLGHENFDNEQLGINLNRKFGQRVSGYVNYSFRRQNSNFTFLQFSDTLLAGNSHTVGLGFNFTPRGIRLKR